MHKGANHILPLAKSSLPDTEPADYSDERADTCRNVNLLCFFLIVLTLIGSIFVYLQDNRFTDIVSGSSCIAAFLAVYCLNHYKSYEVANVLFFLGINVLTLFAVSYAGHSIETELMYVFLILLIFFLFKKRTTRILCLLLVIMRMGIYEASLSYDTPKLAEAALADGAPIRIVFNVLLWAVIVFTLLLYIFQQTRMRRLQAKNKLFYQHMAHDTHTAYSSVASISEHLYQITADNRSLKNEPALVKRLAEASDFCGYILKDFLAYTKYRNNIFIVNCYEEIDLEAEIRKIAGYHRHIMEEKNIYADIQVNDNLPGLVIADRIKVNRIFLNLLTNAIKNAPAETTIRVGVGMVGKKWELTVANKTGKQKMPPLPELFHPYKSRQNTDKPYGLGLPITKMLVDAVDGSITVRYTESNEILFSVVIPLKWQ